ncbi:MAG: hypothetical protein CHACPFDD_02150 [Phycisphaerae bacterium]|nr:hypothetical protein [Phycisphaerae bacterium]
MTKFRALFTCVVVAASAAPALATFHLMQIEQIIGGVNGDTSAQAIQLRMRSGLQNNVSEARLIVRDANGLNPIVLLDIASDVVNQGTGVRILIASANFANYTVPAAQPDFIMTNLIPPSYLAAGSLTFEDDFGSLPLWRFSWGGVLYTGANNGQISNDSDGNFGPPWADAMPSTSLLAVRFTKAASALHVRNDQDYALTSGAAVFFNNAGSSFTVTAPAACVPCDTNCDGSVNGFDIDNLVGLLSGSVAPCSPCAGDVNDDGSVNGFDIDGFVDALAGGGC